MVLQELEIILDYQKSSFKNSIYNNFSYGVFVLNKS